MKNILLIGLVITAVTSIVAMNFYSEKQKSGY